MRCAVGFKAAGAGPHCCVAFPPSRVGPCMMVLSHVYPEVSHTAFLVASWVYYILPTKKNKKMKVERGNWNVLLLKS